MDQEPKYRSFAELVEAITEIFSEPLLYNLPVVESREISQAYGRREEEHQLFCSVHYHPVDRLNAL